MEVKDFSYRRVGRYLLSTLLGTGAHSAVYQGIDITQDASPIYAIKCMPKRDCPDLLLQQVEEIFNHRTVARCRNVLKLYDVIEENGYFFLVLPLCEMDMFGAIWKEKIYWGNDFLIKKAFLQVLDGVYACHNKGVYHRDLKPENIMCDANGLKIKIADFGLSTDYSISREGGCGTAPYMSPECWDEEAEYSYPIMMDIWSLGMVLFNMVTCRFPWETARPTDMEYLAFLCSTDHMLRKYPISDPLNTLLLRIWHPWPVARPSIPEIREAILEMDTFYESYLPDHTEPLFSNRSASDLEQTTVDSAEKRRLDAKERRHVSLDRGTARVRFLID